MKSGLFAGCENRWRGGHIHGSWVVVECPEWPSRYSRLIMPLCNLFTLRKIHRARSQYQTRSNHRWRVVFPGVGLQMRFSGLTFAHLGNLFLEVVNELLKSNVKLYSAWCCSVAISMKSRLTTALRHTVKAQKATTLVLCITLHAMKLFFVLGD